MSSEREWGAFVEDMIRAIERIQGQTSDRSPDDFASDQDAIEIVARNFQVLGEAASRLPSDVTESRRELPWSEMRTMRNRIVHGYHDLDPAILWDTATVEVP